jgi:hypothetical protein
MLADSDVPGGTRLSTDSHDSGPGQPSAAGSPEATGSPGATGATGAQHPKTGGRRWRVPALAGAAVVVTAGLVLTYALTGSASDPDDDARAGNVQAGPAASSPGGEAAGAERLGAAQSKGASAKPGPAKAGGDAPAARSTRWPGPDDTGVPAGTQLSRYDGSLKITKANTTIDGKTIDGCVQVMARNVTIRRSKITCADLVVRVYDDANLTLEDSELDGQGTGMALGYGNYTVRRVEIHNINEGPRVSDNSVIEDSWIHGLVRREGDHQDILQTTGGVAMVVRHNALEAYDPRTKDPFNAAFMLGSETAPQLADLLVEDNLMTGGNYTVNFRDDATMHNIVFRNNTFQRNARYGPVSSQETPGITWASSNVFAETGKPVA